MTTTKSPEAREWVEWMMRRFGAETPAELARLIHEKPENVHRWHRGDGSPSFTKAMRVMRRAGVLTEDAPAGYDPTGEIYERFLDALITGLVAAVPGLSREHLEAALEERRLGRSPLSVSDALPQDPRATSPSAPPTQQGEREVL